MSARPPGGRVAWLGTALAAGGAWQALPVQRRCAHEHAEDVRDLTGALVARLCLVCEAQLPPSAEALKGDR